MLAREPQPRRDLLRRKQLPLLGDCHRHALALRQQPLNLGRYRGHRLARLRIYVQRLHVEQANNLSYLRIVHPAHLATTRRPCSGKCLLS
jgi:hypothetical protein